ncbi:phosphoglucosamine mutase [Natranaeroarchaeum aerophilus]|uniref:Phosphoglucosamine mutase n=1 Tax=Natranaeroarchaeum aerophilus TaxID=2917711 RepID=A0AAE3FQ16_9EURY|nr:phosphoglucosamine mutase [Natranaeroarchaeum aerophilus]MCL9813482.1 phosphoglucosamine mutase [Natranaeroarchaeum aerophilus]
MFGTSGVRGEFGTDVTVDLAISIGRALVAEGAERIVLGRDPRTTGPLLADALSAAVRESGGDIVDCGMVATPTLARAVAWRDADAGVMITASHNPPEDNGIKLWTPSGMAFDEERRERIATLVEVDEYDPATWDAVGTASKWDDATARHHAAIVDAVAPIEKLSVVVDVGNGAGGVTAGALRDLGCSVETLNAEPDGHFPSRPSEPTEDACETLQALVGATDADLGIAHDGDGDRMMAVDETGQFLGGDALLALFGRRAVGEGGVVAAPLNTSLAVDDTLAEVGASLTRTRVGDVYVAERARADDVVFGGEPSGAWIWPEETLAPDGPLAAAKLAVLVDREGPLSALVAELPSYPLRRESMEVEAKREVMERVAARAYEEYDSVETLDGVRVEREDGWFLVRASGTQPLVRVTTEGRTEVTTSELYEEARVLLEDAIDAR